MNHSPFPLHAVPTRRSSDLDRLPRPLRLLLGATGLGVSDRRLMEAAAGKVMLITGASSGVGRATARRLGSARSEEHTSELQSRFELVCRLLLEKKNNQKLTG